MYTYTATGSRIRKEVIQGSTTTDYLYSGGFVYKDSTLEYVTHQEGRMVEDAQGDFVYQYNISDHLGNVRISFEATAGDSLTLLQENHYYPFGLVYMGEGQSQIGSVNQFKYQTKELQDEFSLHWYDFGARMYDAQIGRWHVADAASQFYSPYLAMANNPIRMIDPTGLWADQIVMPSGGIIRGQAGYAAHQRRKQGSYWNWYTGKFVVNPQDENYKWFAWVFDESNSFKDIADVNDEFGGGSGGSDFRFRILKYKENACADEFAKNEEKRHKYMQLVEEDPAAAEAYLDEILRDIRSAKTGLMQPDHLEPDEIQGNGKSGDENNEESQNDAGFIVQGGKKVLWEDVKTGYSYSTNIQTFKNVFSASETVELLKAKAKGHNGLSYGGGATITVGAAAIKGFTGPLVLVDLAYGTSQFIISSNYNDASWSIPNIHPGFYHIITTSYNSLGMPMGGVERFYNRSNGKLEIVIQY